MSSFDLYYDYETSEDDCDMAVFRRRLRDQSNPLELPYNLFIRYFRINKEDFLFLLNKLEIRLQSTIRVSSVTPIIKLAATLRFFAEESYQTGCGNEYVAGLAQSTFSKVLKQTVTILEEEICANFIRFPTTNEEKDRIKLEFYRKSGIPGIIGCIDGTHLKIASPSKEERHLYRNRKGFYSLNAMLLSNHVYFVNDFIIKLRCISYVCDDRMHITFVDINNPGSYHDSFIYNLSELDTHLEYNFNNGQIHTWLLGDAGYGLKPYLITPFRASEDGSRERWFNKKHSRARNIIERTIGILKNHYRCLINKLYYKPEKAAQIANVCCALHNMRIMHNVAMEIPTHPNTDIDQPSEPMQDENFQSGERVREQLMNSIWPN